MLPGVFEASRFSRQQLMAAAGRDVPCKKPLTVALLKAEGKRFRKAWPLPRPSRAGGSYIWAQVAA
jgi:hypothetical protein